MYQLTIRVPQNESPTGFQFQTFEEAERLTYEALETGRFRHHNLTYFTGEGSFFFILSAEEKAAAARAQEEAKKSGGLTGARHDVKPEDFVLVVQIGMIPLHLTYPDELKCDAAIEEAMRTNRIEYSFKPKHDHVYIRMGSGMMLIKLPGEVVIKQRREAVAMQQRQLAASVPNPKLVLPFGRK